MRPTPREEIDGIRRVLAEVVLPAVSDEYAGAQLQQAIFVLDRLGGSWERAMPSLLAENRALEGLFAKLASLVQDRPEAAELVRGLEAVSDLADELSSTPAFGQIQERNQELRGLLGVTLLRLDSLSDDEYSTQARGLAASVMRANLDRALNTKDS